MASIDEACQRLGIEGPRHHSRCIGITLKRKQCRNVVSQPSLSLADDQLAEIDRRLRHGRAVGYDKLHRVASLLLCKRDHQNQADETVRRWRARLETMTPAPPREPARGSINPVSTQQISTQGRASRTSTPQRGTAQPCLRSCSTQELTSEIRARLQPLTDPELLAAIVDITSVRNQTHVVDSDTNEHVRQIDTSTNRLTETTRDVSETSASSTSRTTSHTAPRQASPRPRSTSRRLVGPEASSSPQDNPVVINTNTTRTQTSVHRPATTGEDIRQARIRALTSTQISATPVAVARSPSPLRSSHVECGICMEPYGEVRENHWECRSCLNRAHTQCFESWRASPSDWGVRCMYCRVEVTE